MAVVTVFLFCNTANAATDGIYTYKVTDGKATITDCDASVSGSIVIPSTLGGYPVTGIGSYAFDSCSSLTRILIPSSVTSIGFEAFRECSSLTTIEVSAENPSYCSQDGVLFNKDCTKLICCPDGKTSSYVIPDGVTSISDYAFKNCSSLTSITIPNSVTSIGSYAFDSCSSLTAIEVSAKNPSYCSQDGVLFNKDCTELICCPGGRTGSYVIPDSVTSIGSYAFWGCNSLTSVTIPDSVTSIGSYAFWGCNSLTSVTIPNSVTHIDEGAFCGCRSLTSVTIPNSVTNIGYSAFCDCSSLTSITIPNSVTGIGNYAFSHCTSLTSLTIGNSVTSIGYESFYDCISLSAVHFWGDKPAIGNDAFGNASNQPAAFAFYPKGNETYPESGTNSENLIWFVDGEPSDILASGPCGDGAVWQITRDGCLTISGFGTMNSYPNIESAPWYAYRGGITQLLISSGIDNIGAYAFCNCSRITNVAIPNSVTSIDDYAFSGCSGLTSITIPDGVTSIGVYAFEGCSSLTSITIPDSVTYIDDSAFIDCSGLTAIEVSAENPSYCSQDGVLFNKDCTELIFCPGGKTGSYVIPNGVTRIGHRAFWGCSSLTSITIPDGVASIGWYAFEGCSSLTSIAIPNSVTSIGWFAFEYCRSLTDIMIPASVTSIGNYAFYGCSSLASITIPNSVTDIGYAAFYGCNLLRDVYYTGSKTQWGKITISSGNEPLTAATIHYCEHSYESTVTPPSCTKIGYTTHICSICGDSYIDTYIGALGHDYKDTVTDPTCMEKGYTTHTCSRCDDSYVDTYVEALGHDFGAWTETKAATCTEKGEERRDCSRCDHYETREVEALGHDYKDTVTDPTCTEQGYTTHTCSRCDDSYVDSYVDALGHDFGAWTETKAATCTEKGEERRDCSRCEHYEIREVEVLGHDFGAWTETKAATCTEKGEERRDCSRCEHYETREVEVLGHDYKDTVTDPTCTEQGYTTHTCAHCEDSYVDSYVDALGHDFGAWTETKAATCTEKGEERRDCSRCEHYEIREVEALGHDYKDTVTDPTCTEQGYTTHTCSRCDDSYVDSYVDALGHDFGAWTETKAATCTEKGAERRDCSRCDHYETREVEALGHDFGAWTETKAATCTEKGEERRDCSRCEHYETREVEALRHDYKATVTDPTCTEQGYTTHACSRCDDSYVDSYVDELGHDFGTWTETKAATCTEKGEERRDCSRCEHYETREIEALGHDYKATVTDPTCTEQGYTTHTCSRCDDSYVDTYVYALGHDFGEWAETKAATCTEKGEERRDCSRCDHYETREVEALGHDYKATVTDPTCTEQGYTTHTCTRCNDSYADSYADALGHRFGQWVSNGDATEEKDGTKTRTCSVCGFTETETDVGSMLPATPWVNPYTDVKESAWYYDSVSFATNRGLFNGTSATTFGPNDEMTRAMFVTVLYRLDGSPAIDGGTHFTDIFVDAYYYDAVKWANANGIVYGTDADKFSPDASVTREQMVTFLYRYANYKGVDTGYEASLAAFTDANSVSDYALHAMAWSVGADVIHGSDGMLLPSGTATRAEVATMLKNYVLCVIEK